MDTPMVRVTGLEPAAEKTLCVFRKDCTRLAAPGGRWFLKPSAKRKEPAFGRLFLLCLDMDVECCRSRRLIQNILSMSRGASHRPSNRSIQSPEKMLKIHTTVVRLGMLLQISVSMPETYITKVISVYICSILLL